MTADVQRQFEGLGVSVERTDRADDKVAVWPENWPSVRAFLACATQWRSAVTRRLVWLGLDYSAVKVLLDAEGLGPEVFEDLRTMETAALPVLNEGD